MPLRSFALALLVIACGGDAHDSSHGDHDHADGGHVHVAPHGGALVVFGDEALHVEFVLHEATGELTAYVLDGEAERAVRLAAASLVLTITPPTGEAFELELGAQANALAEETVGDTSEFRGSHDALKGLERFTASIAGLEARGLSLGAVEFAYPEGNE